jgi:hypothetical protein
LFVREHNRRAQELADKYPTMTDNQLYNYARRFVIALLQVWGPHCRHGGAASCCQLLPGAASCCQLVHSAPPPGPPPPGFRVDDSEGCAMSWPSFPSPLLDYYLFGPQKITYDEYLPALLGHTLPAYSASSHTKYRELPPITTTEYVTVASRVLDSMVRDSIGFLFDNGSSITRSTPLNPKLPLVRAFALRSE